MFSKIKNYLNTIFLVIALVVGVYTFIQFRDFKEIVIKDLNTLNEKSISVSNNSFKVDSKSVESKIPYNTPIKVVDVIDGDTIELEGGERLRYIGIDTPEMNFGKAKGAECFAKEATERNEQLVLNKNIKFINDKNVRDKYGRLLGFVYLEDGTFVNGKLVKEGYATSYPYKPDLSKQSVFDEAEKSAKEQNIGIWNKCTTRE